jgi:hypothetical protein
MPDYYRVYDLLTSTGFKSFCNWTKCSHQSTIRQSKDNPSINIDKAWKFHHSTIDKKRVLRSSDSNNIQGEYNLLALYLNPLLFLPSLILLMIKIIRPLALICFISTSLQAQQVSRYNPAETFSNNFYSHPGNDMRTAEGKPGKAYWQNRADYKIKANLDTVKQRLSASETITYTNNSPNALTQLWLHLDQQIYTKEARAKYTGAGYSFKDTTAGNALTGLRVTLNGKTFKAAYLINDTRLQIRLPEELKGSGEKIQIHIDYQYNIPGKFGNRTDFVQTKNGKIFEVAQWYPRMCVYDELRGWDTLPFLGSGEFFLEYGDFDYEVTLPWDMIVAGSGELQNEKEVLSTREISRLDQARKSDKTVMIRTLADLKDPKSRPIQKGLLTWHFLMKNTRDVAFGASKAFIWDAAKVNLPDGKTSLAMSVYPEESLGNDRWSRSTEYLKGSIEHFSSKWYPYPYPVAINEAGIAGGMEYPGILFDGIDDKEKTLFFVTAHEIGHNWFPMIVGSDERRNAWMDEGFNTFIDVYASDEFNKGEYAPKRDSEYAENQGNPADEIIPFIADKDAPTIMTAADAIKEKYRHPIAYFKPAFGLILLREQILGEARFDYAFRQYISDWAYKHPSPNDFFHAMENAGGEDLSWFWKGWFYNNWQLDQAINKVSYVGGSPAKGVNIEIENLDKMVMPVTVQIVFKDGTKLEKRLPVETWLINKTYTLNVPTTKAIVRVVLDPKQALPDSNRGNNTYQLR